MKRRNQTEDHILRALRKEVKLSKIALDRKGLGQPFVMGKLHRAYSSPFMRHLPWRKVSSEERRYRIACAELGAASDWKDKLYPGIDMAAEMGTDF